MTRRRRRILRGAMWTCAACSLVAASAWVWSGWWLISSHSFSGVHETDLRLMRGGVWLVHGVHPPGWPITTPMWPGKVEVEALSAHYTRTPVWDRWIPKLSRRPLAGGGTLILAEFPLWIAVALASVPAGACWLKTRRKPAGYCTRCGYDLSGSPAGVCPECGAGAATHEASAAAPGESRE